MKKKGPKSCGSKEKSRKSSDRSQEYFQFLALHWRRVALAYPAYDGMQVNIVT